MKTHITAIMPLHSTDPCPRSYAPRSGSPFGKAMAPPMSERIRRVLRFRLALIQLLVIPVILTIFTSLPAMAVDVTFTADNAYEFGYGNATGVTTLSPAVVNLTAGAIFNCGPGPESYPGISNAGGGYIYIVAWSDQSSTQGVLGQFVEGTSTTYTGIGGWEVYATGMPISPITAAPTLAQVNAQIALANTNGGVLPNSSVGWVTQAPPTGGRIGLLASGETNALATGNFPIVCQTLINPGARWMWYNRNSTGSGNPFAGPAPAGEYLIFRLPVSQIVNPKAFYANKDIKNMTGGTAAGVEIEVAGHHSYNDIYHATTPVFTVDATGANDKLRWTGGTILAGAVVHVGFRTNDPVIDMLGVTMLNGSGASIGCALQLNTGIHTNANLTWHNTVTNCTPAPMFVGDGTLEYYLEEVPLADLVAGGARTPFHTDTLGMAATLIAPSGTLTVPIPAAPNGARWIVVHQGIGSTAALGETEDWLQVPVECSRLYTVTNANQLATIDVDNACATTIIGVTRDTASGPVRRIRGLAYDAVNDIMYGMTREGDLVTVDRSTAATTFLLAITPHGSPPNFWSGLAFNGTDKLYSTNAFGAHELVEITNVTTAIVVGSTTFSGNPLQILGLDFYPSSAPSSPPTGNGTHPALGVLYGSNRNNQNIVVVDQGTGAVTMPMGNHTVGVTNLQEIAFHPQTGVLYTIHDHFSSSNNAALSTYNFSTEMSTELCELPFGIVETVGGGNDTYGWGGLAFAPCPPTSTPTPTPTPTPTATATITPTPTPTPTPTSTPTCGPLTISGTVRYCPNPALPPMPGVTMTLTGSASGTTTTDANGNYTFSGLPCGGNYSVTPSHPPKPACSVGINTVDVIAAQRHFLGIPPLSGCRLTAADVNMDGSVNTLDVIAIQRFFNCLTGYAGTGTYKFIPAKKMYMGITTNQTGQDFTGLVLGDTSATYAYRPEGPSQDAADDDNAAEVPATVTTLSLPNVAIDASVANFIAEVITTAVDAKNKLVGFQGDFTFDERVVAFQSEPVRKAGITAGDWNVSGNVLPGAGPIRTLRISAYSNDFTPLSGSGTLFALRMTRASKAARGTPMLWAAPPDQFIFIDADLNTQKPGNAAPGSVTLKR